MHRVSDLQCAARLVCLRHGESENNHARVLSAAPPGPRLTALGRDQAAAAARSLRAANVRHVYTSNLRRAEETGEIVAEALRVPWTVVADLREFSLGVCEGRPAAEALADCDAVYRAWLEEGDLDRACDGGETGRELLTRVQSSLADIADRHRGETVVVVGHGGFLSFGLTALCANLHPARVIANPLANCGSVVVDSDGDGWRAVSWCGTDV